MSNATQHSHSSGDSRRRRSRGGRRRTQHQSDSRRSGEHGSNRNDTRGSNSQRVQEFRPQSQRQPRQAPAPLTWWQKLLQKIGLFKAPVPARTERKPEPKAEPKPTKSNTRNARTNESRPSAEKSRESSTTAPAKRGTRERTRGGDGASVESPRVYVGNLSYDVTEQDLQELFKGIGAVRNVEIVYNRSTHRSKGYGFVEMLHKDEAVRSVEVLHDQPFMGRKLVVSGAKSKGQDEREDREDREISPPRKVEVAPLPPADEAPVAETPAADAPVAEAPGEEVPLVEPTVAESPVAESPAAEEPVAEPPAPEPAEEPKAL